MSTHSAAYDFVAYIDEAGDEGYQFVPPPGRKSSEWFVLSCAITHVSEDARVSEAVRLYKETAAKDKPFHFAPSPHEDRVGFLHHTVKAPFHAVSVMAHKPSMPEDAAIRCEKHYLYYFCAKLIIERASWYSMHFREPSEDGKVKLVFSNRRQLKLQTLVDYVDLLRSRSRMTENKRSREFWNNDIKWPVIDTELIEIAPHSAYDGLQIADSIASATAKALEFTCHSLTEHRYMKMLRNKFWKRSGKHFPYGLKFIPTSDQKFGMNEPRLHWLRHYGITQKVEAG